MVQDASSPGVAHWPQDKWISPSALKVFRNCPKRLRLQYIEDIPRPWAYELNLRKGTIAHNILRDIAYILRGRYPLIGDEEILNRTLLRMPVDLFPSPEARDAHAHDVVRWVRQGIQYLLRISDPTWLLIEKNQHRKTHIVNNHPSNTLIARPDAIIQHVDEDGELLIEIIDYKTGVIRAEEDPPVMMRFVAWDLLQDVVGNASAAQVRFTYLWLDHAESTHIDLSVEYCNHIWPDIIRQVSSLVLETDWPATPSRLCEYCPYYQNACGETIPRED